MALVSFDRDVRQLIRITCIPFEYLFIKQNHKQAKRLVALFAYQRQTVKERKLFRESFN